MEQRKQYLIFLLGVELTLCDRRDGKSIKAFTVVPFADEHPKDFGTVCDMLRKDYGRLGYDVWNIEHKESKVKELDLLAVYRETKITKEQFEQIFHDE